jgi:hypothetical protein
MRASIYNVFWGESLLLESATLACLLALQAIAWQARTIGMQLDWIASMRAGMIASLQTCVPIANLLYMCKAKKLLPGGNAFYCKSLAFRHPCISYFPYTKIRYQLATSLHVVQVASLHESFLLVCFSPFAVKRHLAACMLVSMRDSY